MNIQVHFFGMIAEAIETKLLIIEEFEGHTIGELKAALFEFYPKLNDLRFTVAHNKKMVPDHFELLADNEVALLPPFAGG